MSTTGDARPDEYAPGHASDEVARLIDQGRWFADLTERFFRDAGMQRAMRVLDIGCGVGDVSFLAARIVGSDGAVIGVDRSAEAVAVASARAVEEGLTNVRFLVADGATVTLPEPVDMVVGRLVLMYLPDPAAVIRHLRTALRDDGVLAFQEFDLAGATSEPRCPLFELAIDRIRQTFGRTGIDARMGPHLGRHFEAAGLPAPALSSSAKVERGPDARIYRQLAGITRALLPLITRTGVASAEEVDVDSLEARLREEARALDATLVAPPLIGAWARNVARLAERSAPARR
jgi:SAM-dependent methyltransferase